MLDQEFQQFKKAMRDEGLREGIDKGMREGQRQAKAEAILRIFSARTLPITDAERAHILACTDLAQLDRWLERAISAASVADVLK